MESRPQKLTLSIFRSLHNNDSLFDFGTPITEDVLIINGTSKIYRKKSSQHQRGKRIKVVSKQEAMNGQMPEYDYQMLLNVTAKKNNQKTQFELDSAQQKCQIDLNKLEALNQLPFICLNNHGRTNQIPSHKIEKGDLIRLGKLFFEVIQTHLSRLQANLIQQNRILSDSLNSLVNQPYKACRICLMEDEESNDLIAPCDCKGTCQYVHFSCLQTWIKSKVKKQQNRLVSTYSLSRMECELCKKSLPNKIKIGEQVHTLIQFERPQSPFIILERLGNEGSKTFIVLTPNEQEIKIGRGVGTDLRISDISISRVHSSVFIKDNQFQLRDEGSKFGSLIHLKKGAKIDKLMCLQVGSKVYKFETLLRNTPRVAV